MNRNRTLELLIDLQRRDRDRRAGVAARARREADTAGSTLRMLEGYRSDYDQRAPKRGTRAFDTRTVQVHEAFTGKLDQAIGDQQTLARRLDETAALRETDLAEQQRRLKALETLAERRAQAARLRAQRIEQRQTDEFASQAHLRARTKATRHD